VCRCVAQDGYNEIAEVAANTAKGCFGRTGHNGITYCGTPAATIVAAVVTARTAGHYQYLFTYIYI
jgi:hypothetical protein